MNNFGIDLTVKTKNEKNEISGIDVII